MLKKLSIKQMLIMIMIIPLIVVMLVSAKILYAAYESTNSLTQLNKVIVLSTKIGALVHETQKERGMTAGFLGSKGKKFANKLPQQRQLTNERFENFQNFLMTFNEKAYSKEFQTALNKGLSQLKSLNDIRNKVTQLSIPTGKAIGYYTKTNASLLDTVSSITKLSTNYEVSQRVISYMNFLLSKERAGIERAVGTNTFARDNFALGMKAKFYTLVALQNAYMDSFLKVATQEAQAFYQDTVKGSAVDEVVRMRAIALGQKNEDFGIESGYWFAQITQKINLLKEVENYLANDVLHTVDSAKKSALNNLTVFGILSILSILLTLFLARKIAFAILVNVKKVSEGLNDFFKYINYEKENIPLLDVDSACELGHMSKIINKNIASTQKNMVSDKALIEDTIHVANQIKKGHLDVVIQAPSHNPALSELKNIINEMLQSLNSNINNIMNVLSSYSQFDYRPKVESHDLEGVLKALEDDVNVLRDSFTKILIENKKNGMILNQNSDVLSENMSDISTAANEQAASLEESAASLEEINSNLANSSITIDKMINYGAKVKNSVSAGNELATQTAHSMEEINTQTTAITEAITVIDQIAFQTNILSLNAAVEAATAGEAGKGFAVVAGEVRNLASRSAEAAKEIKSLVENAQNKTDEGKNIANKMISGYSDLNENITSTLELIENVATVSKEQASGINQISDAINRLDQITQQNAHNANHANTLSRTAEEIAKVIVKNADAKEFDGKNSIEIPKEYQVEQKEPSKKVSTLSKSVPTQKNKKEYFFIEKRIGYFCCYAFKR
jgi:methyl-accepting chemotaxis protein